MEKQLSETGAAMLKRVELALTEGGKDAEDYFNEGLSNMEAYLKDKRENIPKDVAQPEIDEHAVQESDSVDTPT